MAQIIYQIVSGIPNFAVSLDPPNAPDQVQTAVGVYSFDNIPEGVYNVTITDGIDCTLTQQTVTAGYTTPTTTRYAGCDLEGSISYNDCELGGEAVITVPPVCQKPEGLTTFYLIDRYDILTNNTTVETSGSEEDACAGVAYLNALQGIYVNVQIFGTSVQAFGLYLYATCYAYSTSTECTYPPDGWYFTYQSMVDNIVYHIQNGIITEIVSCTTTTTTTIIP